MDDVARRATGDPSRRDVVRFRLPVPGIGAVVVFQVIGIRNPVIGLQRQIDEPWTGDRSWGPLR